VIPSVIILDAVDEVSLFDSALMTCGRDERVLDKFLTRVYAALADRSEAPFVMDEYLERFRFEDFNGEFLAPRLDKLFKACFHQLLDKQIYRDNGRFPYVYDSRMGYRTIVLTYTD
jgi:hypothetical protein